MRHNWVELEHEETQQLVPTAGLDPCENVGALLLQHVLDGAVQLLLGDEHVPVHCLVGRQLLVKAREQSRNRRSLFKRIVIPTLPLENEAAIGNRWAPLAILGHVLPPAAKDLSIVMLLSEAGHLDVFLVDEAADIRPSEAPAPDLP